MKILAATESIFSLNSRIILSGMIIPNVVMMYRDFDYSKPLGFTPIHIINDELYIEINDRIIEDYKGLYPSIGFSSLESVMENGILIHVKTKLIRVGICSSENINPLIKPI
jgi:hypothetical protein